MDVTKSHMMITVSENKARKLFRKDTSFGVIFTSTRRNFLKLQIFDTFTESSTGNWKCKQTNYLNLSKNSLHARDTCPNYLNRTGSLDAFRPLFNGGFERLICNASLWSSTFQLLSWSKIRVFCRIDSLKKVLFRLSSSSSSMIIWMSSNRFWSSWSISNM